MALSSGAKAIIALFAIGGGLAGLAYMANKPATTKTSPLGSSGFPSRSPGWTNDETTEIIRDENNFIKEVKVSRHVFPE